MKATRELKQQTPGSAGFDLEAADDVMFQGPYPHIVGTGVKVEIPRGMVGLVTVRSSMAVQGVMMANSVGVIDSDYRGEIKMILLPTPEYVCQHGWIRKGRRIGQLVIGPYYAAPGEVVPEEGLERSARGEGGLGSTGK